MPFYEDLLSTYGEVGRPRRMRVFRAYAHPGSTPGRCTIFSYNIKEVLLMIPIIFPILSNEISLILKLTGNYKKIGVRYHFEILCNICGNTKFISKDTFIGIKTCPICRGLGDILTRISKRYTIDPSTECHLWASYLTKDGYAQITYNNSKIRVSKFILEKKLGRPLLENYETCHTCNNRNCINPQHLYEGTHKQNALDMKKAGSCKGVKNGHSKISVETAIKIKQELVIGNKPFLISKKFNVPPTLVANIKKGSSWKWLDVAKH